MHNNISDMYDDVTLELEHAEVLTRHIEQQLFSLSDDGDKAYALCLVAKQVNEFHENTRNRLAAMWRALREGYGEEQKAVQALTETPRAIDARQKTKRDRRPQVVELTQKLRTTLEAAR